MLIKIFQVYLLIIFQSKPDRIPWISSRWLRFLPLNWAAWTWADLCYHIPSPKAHGWILAWRTRTEHLPWVSRRKAALSWSWGLSQGPPITGSPPPDRFYPVGLGLRICCTKRESFSCQPFLKNWKKLFSHFANIHHAFGAQY